MEKRLVLNSWKEIADYMGRGVRTVQRWERDLMLPVHRPAGKSRSAVIAFSDEIEQWMRKGALRTATSGKAIREARITTHQQWQRLMANSETLLKETDALRARIGELARLMQKAEKYRKALKSGAPVRAAFEVGPDSASQNR